MARAAARIADLEAGTLPCVCAKTGEAADGSTKVEFTSSPSWTLIPLLFGILPFLIAQHFATIRVVGILPMSDDALGRVRTFNRTVLALIVLSVVVLVAGLLATDVTVVLIGLALLLAVLLLLMLESPFVLPTGQVTGEWVRLSFVHPRFADALDGWYGSS